MLDLTGSFLFEIPAPAAEVGVLEKPDAGDPQRSFCDCDTIGGE
jgi:hypothetical protein